MERELQTLRDLALRMVGKLAMKDDLTPTEIDNAMKAVCLLDKIDGREMMEQYGEGPSGNYYGNYGDGGNSSNYGNGSSYRRGRSPITGRYVSRSGHSIQDRAISKLERMMDETSSGYEREELGRLIEGIRSME